MSRAEVQGTEGFADLQARWAASLLSSLADAGLREVVISPGSRSTPFVLAAQKERRLRCHSLVDERTAAFFALGQARVSGRASLLLCTSGSAAANYFPALVEAAAAQVPLLLLTADRPLELSACGANQAIDQVKLYGDHVRFFLDLGLPDAGALGSLPRIAAQAWLASRYPEPGPVHLNARARKPLEPPRAELPGTVSPDPAIRDPANRDPASRDAAQGVAPSPQALPRAHPPCLLPDPAALQQLAEACGLARRGIIVCGPASLAASGYGEALDRLALSTGFPVFSECASQQRLRPRPEGLVAVDRFPLLLADPRRRKQRVPDLVLQIGSSPTAGSWDLYLRQHLDLQRWVLAPRTWLDPQNTASHLLLGDLEATLNGLLQILPSTEAHTARAVERQQWSTAWAEDEELAAALQAQVLARTEGLSEAQVARCAAASLPEGGLLALGNSLPVRQADLWLAGGQQRLQVWSQRGASGIDGLVAGAAGAAMESGRPTVLVLGDISFLHDLGGLAAAGLIDTPLVLLVVQNQGGRIFEQLPVAAHPAAADEALAAWVTPHQLSFGSAAQLHGFTYQQVEDEADLQRSLSEALTKPGVTVLEAVVPPSGARDLEQRLRQQLVAGNAN